MLETDFTVERLVPYASNFLREGRPAEPEGFLSYLRNMEAEAELVGKTTGLLARGIRAADLNGEAGEALQRAQLLGEVRHWHDVLCLDKTRRHPRLEDYIQAQRGLTRQELDELRPLITWALSKCLHVQ